MPSRLLLLCRTAAAAILLLCPQLPLPSDAAPMCTPPRPRVRIVDEAVSSTITSASAVGDPAFRSFISTQTSFLSSRLASLPACIPATTTVSLTFVRLPLTASPARRISRAPILPPGGGAASCRLESPWLRMLRSGATPARLDLVYIWNERQFLWDQLLLRNPASRAPRPLLPLNDSDVQRQADMYAQRVLKSGVSASDPALRRAIPADILLLFTRAPQSTRGPFALAALSTMPSLTRAALPATNALTQALINRCLTQRSSRISITTLAELKGIFDINRLKLPGITP